MKVYAVNFKWIGGQGPDARHEAVSSVQIGTVRFTIADGVISYRKHQELLREMRNAYPGRSAQPYTVKMVTEDGRTPKYPIVEGANIRFIPLEEGYR